MTQNTGVRKFTVHSMEQAPRSVSTRLRSFEGTFEPTFMGIATSVSSSRARTGASSDESAGNGSFLNGSLVASSASEILLNVPRGTS